MFPRSRIINLPRIVSCCLTYERFFRYREKQNSHPCTEDPALRRMRRDIHELIRLRPSLQLLALQIATPSPDQKKAYPAPGKQYLRHVRYVHISDKQLDWHTLSANMDLSLTCCVHPDLILPTTPAYRLGKCMQDIYLHAGPLKRRTTAPRYGTAHAKLSHPQTRMAMAGIHLAKAMAFRDPYELSSAAATFTISNGSLPLVSLDHLGKTCRTIP